MRKSSLDYGMGVIVRRALPEVPDGLRPVHRRILYAMHELGLVPGRPYKKSATVVGDVLGKYHPHGDVAVYDSLVRMVQSFSLRYPLVDGQGNFGSVDGDPPAAYRYTEARLTRIAMTMLDDIDKNTVDFVPNFDDRLQEPTVLPARLPNLIVNGTSGIAVGMATNIPPHNLSETVEAINHLVDHPDASLKDLRKFIKGPDFPTGAIIYGREGIKECYEQTADRRHGDSLSGEQGESHRADRRARERQEDRRDLGHPGLLRPRGDARRHRLEARCRAGRRAEPALQAFADVDDLRRDHARPGRRGAEGNEPEGDPRALHRASPYRHRSPHRVRAEARAGPRAHPRRLEDRRRQHRRGREDHPQVEGHADGGRQPAQALQAVRKAVGGNPQHAARPAHRPRDHQARRRAQGSPQVRQGVQGDPRVEAAAPEDPQRRALGAGARLRRRAAQIGRAS